MSIISDRAGSSVVPADAAIWLDHIWVRYWRQVRPRNSLQRYLWELARGRITRQPFWPLRDITLTVRHGEVFGIIGPNGSGKSTLLAIAGGMIRPVRGRAVARGRMVALLQPGAGFELELTGRENVLLKSAMMGFSEGHTRTRLDRIVEFAGLREFIDEPLRTYSSGMLARLAFAISTDQTPDILLLDEVLSVGDTEFQLRSRERMFELRRKGTTILLVSHDMATVQTLCDRAAWLSYGRVQAVDFAPKVVRAYLGASSDGLGRPAPASNGAGSGWSSTLSIELRPEQVLVYLRMPVVQAPEVEQFLGAQFPPDQISPPEGPLDTSADPGALPVNRLMQGAFYYDQVSQHLQSPPTGLTILDDPIRSALAVWNSRTAGRVPELASMQAWAAEPANRADISNPLTRRLGIRIPFVVGAPGRGVYAEIPLDGAHLARARDVLGALAFVGIAECPAESLSLLAYTFGWKPANGEPSPGPAARTSAAGPEVEKWLADLNQLDLLLYRFGSELFETRFRQMQRELSSYYGSELGAPSEDTRHSLELWLERNWAERQQVRSRKPHILHFSFDHPVPGRGWYAAEYSPVYGAYRWMGPEERATLQLFLPEDLQNSDLEFRCHVFLAITPQVLLSWQLQANGRKIPLTPLTTSDGSMLYRGVVPRGWVDGQAVLHLEFQVEATYAPIELTPGNADARRLGLAFTSVELERLEQEGSPQ